MGSQSKKVQGSKLLPTKQNKVQAQNGNIFHSYTILREGTFKGQLRSPLSCLHKGPIGHDLIVVVEWIPLNDV